MKNIQLEQNYSRAVKGPQFITVAAMLAEPTAINLAAPVFTFVSLCLYLFFHRFYVSEKKCNPYFSESALFPLIQ